MPSFFADNQPAPAAPAVPASVLHTAAQLGLSLSLSQQQALCTYVAELLKWNQRINLIGRTTAADVWQRHIIDCLQLVPHCLPGQRVLDVGTGAGLPAVVLAIARGGPVVGCERVGKKTNFIKHITRLLQLEAQLSVHADDVRTLPADAPFDIITARAFAETDVLLEMTLPLLAQGGKYVLPVGTAQKTRIPQVSQKYNMTWQVISSITEGSSAIHVIHQ